MLAVRANRRTGRPALLVARVRGRLDRIARALWQQLRHLRVEGQERRGRVVLLLRRQLLARRDCSIHDRAEGHGVRLAVADLVENDRVTGMHAHHAREVGEEGLVRLRVVSVDVDREGLAAHRPLGGLRMGSVTREQHPALISSAAAATDVTASHRRLPFITSSPSSDVDAWTRQNLTPAKPRQAPSTAVLTVDESFQTCHVSVADTYAGRGLSSP